MSNAGRDIMADLVAHVVEQCFMPLTVGGGIRTLDDATRLIQAGAEKVSVNSAAVKNPKLLAEISRKFGRCATVLGLNADGTRAGYDLEMTAAVSEAVKVPVVASGGAGQPKHLLDVLTAGKADAA